MRLSTLLPFLIAAFTFQVGHLAGQVRETGRESAKGSLNFSQMAQYQLAHPQKPERQKPENEEIGEFHFIPPLPDSSQIRKQAKVSARLAGGAPLSLLPVSPAPADTFESTLDNGTSIPPDTHGAIDATYCVTAINPEVHIQNRGGGSISAVSLNGFWSPVNSSGGTFDPRVHYDMYANRWIMVADCGAQSSSSALLIAVSKTSDPTGAWWEFKVTADATGLNWLDFPCVGFNNKWIMVSGNMFSVAAGAYAGTRVFVFNKANLMSGAGASYTSFSQVSSFSIAPALTYSATEPNLFAVENWNGSAGVMHVWKISGAVGSESMTSVGFPSSTLHWWYSSYPVSGTSGADFAPQVGTTNKIQTNDDRVTQCIFMNGRLWFAHTVFLPYNPLANPTRASVQWWETDTLGNPLQIGLIDDATSTNFYAFPTIAVNNNDDALIGFSTFSPFIHPSCAYALRSHADAVDSTRPLVIYRHGMSTYYKTFGSAKNRWGDYSATNVDPVNLSDFWTLQECSAPTTNLWDTWWGHVSFCAPPAIITGSTPFCAGSSIMLHDATTGGTWSSSNPSVATVGPTGLVTGVAGGTAVISYTLSGGCAATVVVTVNPSPEPILGPSALCVGTSVTLSDAIPGGTWFTSGSALSINPTTGVVTGLSAGSAVITYSLPTGCLATRTEVVNMSMPPIMGSNIACIGEPMPLTDATTGGTWSSSNTSVATIDAGTGVVTGATTGTAMITYSTGSGCFATFPITVDPSPAAITGSRTTCAGATTILSDATIGGSWSSGAPAIATVSGSGIVTGVSAGTAPISYTIVSGCSAIANITVLQSPGVISAPAYGCTGTSFTLSDAIAGGTWSSSNTSVATIVSTTGKVTAIAAGTTNISYTLPDGCMAITALSIRACGQSGIGVIKPDSDDVEIIPNPNAGAFLIKGTWPANYDRLGIQVINALGQVVYSGTADTQSGRLEETITMPSSLASGVYTVRLTSGTYHKAIRIIVTK